MCQYQVELDGGQVYIWQLALDGSTGNGRSFDVFMNDDRLEHRLALRY